MTTTGYLFNNLPEGPERDEALGLIRIGLKFQGQQCGRRPDYFTRYLADVTRGLKRPTFSALLAELELCAARRERYGVAGNPVEKIDRLWKLATFHHPKKGRVQLTFKTLRNKLMLARKIVEKPKCPDLP